MRKITAVEVLLQYRLHLTFDNGLDGIVDLSRLVGRGVFVRLRDQAEFRSVAIGEGGELVWPCGCDLCPNALYLEATGKKAEDVFPALKRHAIHA